MGFFMFVSLQWENRWVFLQLWAIYIPGDDRKRKSYFILQIHLIVNDSSMYFFDLIIFNQSVDLLRQKMTNFSLVMYARFLKTQSLHEWLQARINFLMERPHPKILSTSDEKKKKLSLFKCVFYCPSVSFKPKIWKSTIKMWIILCHYNQAKYHF